MACRSQCTVHMAQVVPTSSIQRLINRVIENIHHLHMYLYCRFDVLQRSKVQAPSGPLQLQTDAPISAWCCINKGHIGMRVAADTDSYLPGDAINISAQVLPGIRAALTCVMMPPAWRIFLTGLLQTPGVPAKVK